MSVFGSALLLCVLIFSSPFAAAQTAAKAQRIVSLTLGTDEILLSLVAPERLIAITSYAADPDISHVSVLAKQVKLRFRHPGVESIVALNPDLIFVASYTKKPLVQQLEALGFPLFKLSSFSSISGIKKNIRLVGQAVGEPEKAENLIAEMMQRLAKVAERLSASELKRPTLLSYSPERWTSGAETTFDEIVTLAGGRNLAAEAGISGHPKISLEAVVDLDPEILILNAWRPEGGDVNQPLLRHPALQSLRAIQENRVYQVPGKHMTTVSHFIVEGVEAMARLLHPGRFQPDHNHNTTIISQP